MLPNYIDPNPVGWVWRLTGIRQGKADEIITGLDLDELSDTRYRLLKDSSLCKHGFIGVSRPVRDGEGHVINVALTDLGDRLLECLKEGLVWSLAVIGPDMEATHKYWRSRIKRAEDPDADVFHDIPRYTHA